jgi:hypothetical protein
MSVNILLLALVTATTPVQVAQRLYVEHRNFYVEPAAAHALLSDHFYKLLSREYQCAQGVECAISWDPWTAAQDGDIAAPITFSPARSRHHQRRVKMCYRFVLEPTRSWRQCAVIGLVRSGQTWIVDDLISPGDISLRNALEAYRYGL